MIIRIRSSVTDERKRQEAATLAAAIERDRKEFFRVLARGDPERAQELDHAIDQRSRELYQRARDAAGLDQ